MEVKKQEKPGSLSPVKGLRRDDDGKTSRSNSKSERDLRLPEKSPSEDAGRRERRPSRASESSKDTLERQESKSLSPKVSRKYFTNWKQACDKTKDKTKELLKRWRTLPETETSEHMQEPSNSEEDKHHGWSVHVWTTWVNRCSDSLECLDLDEEQPLAQLGAVQSDKLTLFFTELLDHDRDDVICDQDFDNFFEKLAHFADWSNNSSEFHILLEVKQEFIEHFINPLPTKWSDLPYYKRVCGPEAGGFPGRTTLEGWLARWALYLSDMKRFTDLPLYLQYLCKIMFNVIDRTGTGAITKQSLAAFYRSVIGLPATRIDEIIDTAYDRMTSNGYLILDYGTFVHCFTNWLMGKNPNGPGQWVLVPPKGSLPQPPFPVDYSALNTEPAKLEPYAPDKKTNRHSVIV
ncbi:PREDICTED: uncharacterized protein LOC106116866 [Papilio xuthus]|uniref:Uncharacterized protein LOC106116866 n=1 Tax=Papilio xuthus TaxID=66420 RepID=A0A194QDL2_PAPXU|nr:PREDICTED: uncharacterized protein LOC106116866 [Papilio xuthus]KPJ03509.1 hypothetical protein RR46_03575 [Papilio xuthus]